MISMAAIDGSFRRWGICIMCRGVPLHDNEASALVASLLGGYRDLVRLMIVDMNGMR